MKDLFKNWGPVNFIAAVILALIVIVGGSGLGKYVSNRQANQSIAGIESQTTPAVLKTISYDGQDGKNALELLKVDHKVETQDSSLGSFVTSIDDTANTDNSYWMFYVNGELASSGADSYVTKNGEKIEWRLEQFQ
jgi:hypothetical protein